MYLLGSLKKDLHILGSILGTTYLWKLSRNPYNIMSNLILNHVCESYMFYVQVIGAFCAIRNERMGKPLVVRIQPSKKWVRHGKTQQDL